MNEIKGEIPDYNTGLRLTDGEKAMQEINKMKENSWQKCPICEGSGKNSKDWSLGTPPDCPTCKGKRIISTITGKPPSDE